MMRPHRMSPESSQQVVGREQVVGQALAQAFEHFRPAPSRDEREFVYEPMAKGMSAQHETRRGMAL